MRYIELYFIASFSRTPSSTWAITGLVVLEFVWAVRYYRYASSQDRLLLRVLVAATLIIDLAGLIGAQANVYLVWLIYSRGPFIYLPSFKYCVSHWGKPVLVLL